MKIKKILEIKCGGHMISNFIKLIYVNGFYNLLYDLQQNII